MSKCENCIHYDRCDHYHIATDTGKYAYQNIDLEKRDDVEDICDDYKDKSLFVELPCKVGDEVFWIDWANGVIESTSLLEINFDGEHLWFEVGAGTCLGDEEIFLDREEAEKKLKEMG